MIKTRKRVLECGARLAACGALAVLGVWLFWNSDWKNAALGQQSGWLALAGWCVPVLVYFGLLALVVWAVWQLRACAAQARTGIRGLPGILPI